jgi:hypothetical protein
MRFEFKSFDTGLRIAILAGVMILPVWSVGRSGVLVFVVPTVIGAGVAGIWIVGRGRAQARDGAADLESLEGWQSQQNDLPKREGLPNDQVQRTGLPGGPSARR